MVALLLIVKLTGAELRFSISQLNRGTCRSGIISWLKKNKMHLSITFFLFYTQEENNEWGSRSKAYLLCNLIHPITVVWVYFSYLIKINFESSTYCRGWKESPVGHALKDDWPYKLPEKNNVENKKDLKVNTTHCWRITSFNSIFPPAISYGISLF